MLSLVFDLLSRLFLCVFVVVSSCLIVVLLLVWKRFDLMLNVFLN